MHIRKSIQPKELDQTIALSHREWLQIIRKHKNDIEPKVFSVNYEYIKQTWPGHNSDKEFDIRMSLEEALIGDKIKLTPNHFILRVK